MSVGRSVHEVPQQVATPPSPARQGRVLVEAVHVAATQRPDRQARPEPQTAPHPPQLELSVAVFTQPEPGQQMLEVPASRLQ